MKAVLFVFLLCSCELTRDVRDIKRSVRELQETRVAAPQPTPSYAQAPAPSGLLGLSGDSWSNISIGLATLIAILQRKQIVRVAKSGTKVVKKQFA